MSEFREGDKVSLRDLTIDQVDCQAAGLVRLVQTTSTGVLQFTYQSPEDLVLIERPKTPGQIAYDTWRGLNSYYQPWEALYPSKRELWERVAQAVKNTE